MPSIWGPFFGGYCLFASVKGCVMSAKQSEPGPTSKSPEMDIERNVHELKLAGANFPQTANGSDEMAAADLATLLGRVSEVSTSEIENLIGELRGLREKLKIDCDRIKGDVAEYVGLTQGVMQLTAIISDSVKELPRTPRISR
jgi:hypothetical protein